MKLRLEKLLLNIVLSAVIVLTVVCKNALAENKNAHEAETSQWIAVELSFQGSKNLTNANVNPLDDEFDVAFTHGSGTTLNMPGFWDGGNTWRVRFAPTKIGEWTYITQFSDTEDSGLHNVKGTINCVPYEGELDIYKRGFIQADANKRYFTYADGTPFFYLGDTHWSMPGEPFETMFKAIVDNRAAKKFLPVQLVVCIFCFFFAA